MSERYPGARRAYLKSGGDFPFLSRPDEVNLHLQVSCKLICISLEYFFRLLDHLCVSQALVNDYVIICAWQLHLRRVGVEPRPELVRGAPKPSDIDNSHEAKQREYDDHHSKEVGSSRDPSNIEQTDDTSDNTPIDDHQEVADLLKGNEDSCKGPLPGDEGEDTVEPPEYDGGCSTGPLQINEAESTKEPLLSDVESFRDSSKCGESKNTNDHSKDIDSSLLSFLPNDIKPSYSNEQLLDNHADHLLNQDPQKKL